MWAAQSLLLLSPALIPLALLVNLWRRPKQDGKATSECAQGAAMQAGLVGTPAGPAGPLWNLGAAVTSLPCWLLLLRSRP